MIIDHLKHIKLRPIVAPKLVFQATQTEVRSMLFEFAIGSYLVMLGIVAWEDLRSLLKSRFRLKA